jgi:hypothetical protein
MKNKLLNSVKFRDIKLDPNKKEVVHATILVEKFFQELKDNKEDGGQLWEYKDDLIKLVLLPNYLLISKLIENEQST